MSQTLSGSRYELHLSQQGAAECKARDYYAVHPADLADDEAGNDLVGYVHSWEVGSTVDGPGLRRVLRFAIDDRGHPVVRRDREEFGLELIAAADVDRNNPVRKSSLFQEDGDLVTIRCRPVVEIDHGKIREGARH